ncbi:MAG: hypothetical protein PHU23_17345 [Dehalococcoidales bacterium]|nr:hypothetical protein [Dehalococcoidales bacterium]
MTEQKQFPIDWRRIYALPYNPYFKDDVKQMRSYLELPEDGISDNQQAWTWLEKNLTDKRPKPWFLPKPTPSDEKLWKSEIPIWKVAIYLIARYGLPFRMRSNIGLYVVTNNVRFLINWRGLDVDFAINMKAAKLQLVITVDGVDEWTMEEQWHEVWEYWVKPLKRSLGEPAPANKRPGYGKALQERIKRYSEWYQLSELDGLGPAEALEKWEGQQSHLDYVKHRKSGKHYDVSTVTKAIEEFRKLITPIPS